MNWSSIRENTHLAMATLGAHRFRAALTILGVFIGVLVIVAMAAVLNGFRQSVLDQAESFGTRNVYIWRYPFIMTSKPPAEVLNRKPLTLADATAIEQEVAAVEYVYAGLIYGIPLPGEMPPMPPETKYKDRLTRRARMVGNFPVAELVMNVSVNEGRYFTEAENQHRATVCVLAFNMVEALFPNESPIGKTLKLDKMWFTVIGVLADNNLTKDEFEGVKLQDFSNDIYIPLATALKKFELKRFESELDEITLSLKNIDALKPSAILISQVLANTHGKADDYSIVVPRELLEQNQRTQRIFNIVMAGLLLASLYPVFMEA